MLSFWIYTRQLVSTFFDCVANEIATDYSNYCSVLVNFLLDMLLLTNPNSCSYACMVWIQMQHNSLGGENDLQQLFIYRQVFYWVVWPLELLIMISNHSFKRFLLNDGAVLDFSHWFHNELPRLNYGLDEPFVKIVIAKLIAPLLFSFAEFYHFKFSLNSVLNLPIS